VPSYFKKLGQEDKYIAVYFGEYLVLRNISDYVDQLSRVWSDYRRCLDW
jgi:hypothetical protein